MNVLRQREKGDEVRRLQALVRMHRHNVPTLLVSLVGMFLVGCATVGHVRTEGESGPLAWHVTDFKFTGELTDTWMYTFTLVLREREGRNITFTHWSSVRYAHGVGFASNDKTEGDSRLVFQPNQERRFPLSYGSSCSVSGECFIPETGWIWNITYTGTDAESNAVKAVIRMKLPEL